jgi:hypothetical protein
LQSGPFGQLLFLAPNYLQVSSLHWGFVDDLGPPLELSYNTPHWEPSRFSGEMRPIIGAHVGQFDLIVNPILDTDFNGLGKLDFAPAARVAYNLSKKVAVAIEQYADFGPLQHFKPAGTQSQTLFGVLDYRAAATASNSASARASLARAILVCSSSC